MMRLPHALIGSAIIASTTGIAQSQDQDTRIAAILVDCPSFKKLPAGTWLVTKGATVMIGLEGKTGRLPMPEGTVIDRQKYVPNNVDLVDVLNKKCGN